MSRTKTLLTLVAMVLGFGLMMASPTFAITYFSPITAFQDDDMDWHFDSGGVNADGLLSVGDRLYGVVEYEQTYDVFNPGPASETPIAPQELTGVFDLTIVAINSAFGVSQIVFGPTVGSTILDAAAPAGTLVSFYLDNVDDLDIVGVNCISDADCIDKANNGPLWANFGFGGDDDEFWTAIVPSTSLDPDDVFAGNSTSNYGAFNYAVSILTNNTGKIFDLQTCPLCAGTDNLIEVTGSGNILGGQGLDNGAFARSDADTQLKPVSQIPEPSYSTVAGCRFAWFGIQRTQEVDP